MVELSSLDVRLLALELRALEDGYVDKAYETRPGEFVLKIRHPRDGPSHLVIRPGAFVARATEPPQNPETPTTVALTLRKLLTGARIRRVDQHEFDRVLRIQLDRRGDAIELVIELFGKGNLLVAGPDQSLLFVLRTETFAHRTIRRGEKLVFPPPRVNPLTLPRSDFERRVEETDKDVVRFLALDLSLGGDLAEEVVHRAGVAKTLKANELEDEDVGRLWAALRALLEGPSQPAVAATVKGNQVQSVQLQAPLFRDAQRTSTSTLSEAILRVGELDVAEEAPKPDEERARLGRQIVHQERGVEELGREADRWERCGHLLFAHYAEAALAIQKSKATIEATSWGAFAERVRARKDEADSWTRLMAGVDPKRARVLVRLEEEEIPLDPFASLEQNATVLYDESKRIRAKQESAKAALAEARRRLSERALPARQAKPAAIKAPAKRFWFEALRWFYSSEGFLVVAGRDAATNEKLVKRHLSQGDRYCHADVQGAASVIVKCEGKTPGEATMKEACQFAATHSKAFAQFAAADAYWVHPEQVSKTAESGEYVPKGAFIVRGTRHYFPKMKLELALGILRLDAQGRPRGPEAPHRRLAAAPPDAMRKHTDQVALVERGDLKPSDAAKELAPLFGVSLDEVVAALPAGTVRIARKPGAHA